MAQREVHVNPQPHRSLLATAPPILPIDRHCVRYKFLYCIV